MFLIESNQLLRDINYVLVPRFYMPHNVLNDFSQELPFAPGWRCFYEATKRKI